MSSINVLDTSCGKKHREAGRIVASAFEEAVKEIHLQIKKRGKVTTWAARRQQYSTHGSR